MLGSLQLKWLKEECWDVKTDGLEVLSAMNMKTGCFIQGEFTKKFIEEKLQEIKEIKEEKGLTKAKLSDEEILKIEGIEILCESPFELKDSFGNLITGECAHWLKDELVTTYHRTVY